VVTESMPTEAGFGDWVDWVLVRLALAAQVRATPPLERRYQWILFPYVSHGLCLAIEVSARLCVTSSSDAFCHDLWKGTYIK
jgi:hypothetical protein